MSNKVLYIEDNKLDRIIFQRFIETNKFDYDVSFVESVQQTLELLKNKTFDLIIIDFYLTDGNAYNIIPSINNTPFIIFSDKNDPENAVSLMKKGADNVIIKDSEGRHLHTLNIIINNAINRKKSEEELEKCHKKLEVLVKNRTSDLEKEIEERKKTEKELKKAVEKAKESNNLKSSFLAIVSHEIRTPLNAIVGFSQLLKDKNIDHEEKTQYINVISKNSDQLVTIISDIIDISKIEANQIELKKSECNVFNLFLELFLFFDSNKKHKEKKDIKFQVFKGLEKDNSNIYTDEKRLYQVMNNLLNNAFKYTKKGNITFGFRLVNTNELPEEYLPNKAGDNYLLFFVEDTGVGIENNHKDLIFQRFRQGDEQYTRSYGGTGLGLSISKALIKMMGGDIWVDSEKGKGSLFQFYLPYDVKDQEKKTKQTTNGKLSYDWSNKSFLVVEDEFSNYKFIEVILKNTNVTLDRAEDGKQAVEMATKNHYDLILMDIQLPVMNGYEATKIIRNSNKKIPIIAQTAYAMSGDRIKSLKAGCNDYIVKPIKKEILLNAINNLLISGT